MTHYYLILKALHIIAVISWMAGLLYLPRLFVYHVGAQKGGELDGTLKVMERKLLRYIMNPAMVVALITGVTLIHITGATAEGWFHIKGLLLIGMFACHGMMARYRKNFESGNNQKSAKFYKIFNEVPTALMIGIVFLAVLKPF